MYILKLVIASDHAGFELKEELRANLAATGNEVDDLGAFQCEPEDDYPDFAEKVGEAVKAGVAPRGIVICGSGVGVCVAANKIPGIRAGICHDTYSAHQGVEHDDMNVLVLGARIIGSALAFELARTFVAAKFQAQEGRFERRFKKVLAIEAKYQCGDGQKQAN
jgi:ribose 5-phosphate isomerase B